MRVFLLLTETLLKHFPRAFVFVAPAIDLATALLPEIAPNDICLDWLPFVRRISIPV